MPFYPTCAYTLKLKNRIIAYDSSHLALAVMEYDAYMYFKRFAI